MSCRSICLLSLVPLLIVACQSSPPKAYFVQTGGPEKVTFRVLPFDLAQVKLLDGPFKHATDLNLQSLLNYEPDRFLAKFREAAGLEPKAEHYPGWENETIAGHSLGHYLSGCSLMYRTTGDQRMLDRVNYIVDELAACQEADGDGFIGAFPNGKKILTEEVAKGDIRSQGFDLNGIWVPWYNEHKTMAGLRDAYRLCGNQKALIVNRKLADWIETVVGGLTDEQVQDMLNCEHGGINETLADLYADTGDERYLRLSRIFQHKAILEPLAEGEDILPNKHGNTQIPKLIGLERRYELTADQHDLDAAAFFWDRVVHHHSYVTGGHGNHEYFGQPDKLRNRLSDETTETCNVYNMLKLSDHLFRLNASAEIGDFYERALFNHILSSQNPKDGRVIYNLSLEMGGRKEYQDPMWFTCCIGTGMENHSKYGGAIYYHNDEELFVDQFIASELDWPEKGLKLRQDTRFPEQQGSTLTFSTPEPVGLILRIRYPYWVDPSGAEVQVNGKVQEITEAPGSFIAIRRYWKDGDKVTVKFPFTLRLETMPDDTDRIAVMYGPLVLAGDLGPEDDPNAHAPDYVPYFFTEDRNPAAWLKPVAGEPNTFKTEGVGKPRDVVLKPFYQTNERRYSVYWDIFNQQKWDEKQAAYEAELAEKKRLEALTFDFLQMGEMQPERNHKLEGEKTFPQDFQDRKMRGAERGGWFGFQMNVLPEGPMALAVEYWGGFTGSKTFDIQVDGQTIATENISGKADGQFITVTYPIPPELTRSKRRVNIKFMPHVGHRAGPVFSVRMIRTETSEG